ncbi:SMC-Scp complex subunit ScpB [Clostridiales bacterium COT073_COT-073]|nr:SMC-Scp complex subunit ScpB [Clostridiales bacterium COT073_COT-073]
MQIEEVTAIVEALLFSMGEAIALEKLAEVVEIDKSTLKKIMEQMQEKYEQDHRGIRLISLEGAYQLCTKPEYYEYIRRMTNKAKSYELTDVLIETLSIIAYKQPITKTHIEAIRGVKSDHAVNKLIEYGLVEEKGRLDGPGKPIVFGTTEVFLRYFGLSSPEELPVLEDKILEQIQKETENELQMKLEEIL